MPTFLPGFEIPLLLELGGTYAAPSSRKSYIPGFEIPLLLELGGTYAAPSSRKSYIPGFEIPLLVLPLSAITYSKILNNKFFPVGFEISVKFSSPQKKASDTAFEIVLAGVDSSITLFPLSSLGLEILYPITPSPLINKSLNYTDSKNIRVMNKGQDELFSTLKFRIPTDSLSALMGYIKTYRATKINLTTPAVYPFGNSYVRSDVYIVGFSKPVLEKPRFWRIDITFLQVKGVS